MICTVAFGFIYMFISDSGRHDEGVPIFDEGRLRIVVMRDLSKLGNGYGVTDTEFYQAGWRIFHQP